MYLVMQEEKVRRKLAESGVHSYDEECRRKYQIYLQRHVCQNSTKYKFNMYIFLISRWLNIVMQPQGRISLVRTLTKMGGQKALTKCLFNFSIKI